MIGLGFLGRLMATLRKGLTLLFPSQPYVRPLDKLYGGWGALVGIFGLIWSAHYITPQLSLFVVASMGASAVLLFAVPHSPLAQPWALAGGHLLSALAGVSCYRWIPDPYLAAAAGVALAIVLMHFLHCLHPPGGATALFAVMGGDGVHELGYGYVLAPVALNVGLFLTLGLVINNLLIPRRSYPLVPAGTPAKSSPAPAGFGVERSDLETAIREMDGFIDVSEDDLADLTARAMRQARRRLLRTRRVADIMRRDAQSCEYDAGLETVWAILRSGRDLGVPVIDRDRRVIGVVTLADFLDRVDESLPGGPIDRLARLLGRPPETPTRKATVAGHIMSAPAVTVRDDAPLDALMPLFAGDRIHHLPVVDGERRLVGMVSQADLLRDLTRQARF